MNIITATEPGRIIGLTGRSGAGKDTAAEVLAELFAFERLAFADKLREIVSDLYDVPMEHFTDRKKKNSPHPHLTTGYVVSKFSGRELCQWFEPIYDDLCSTSNAVPHLHSDIAASAIFHNLLPYDEPVTPRRALQIIGTEGLRENLFNSVLVDYVMHKARKVAARGMPAVITDVRLGGEADAVYDAGGIVVGICRPDKEEKYEHATEVEVDDLVDNADLLIINDGTIEALKFRAGLLGRGNYQKLRFERECAHFRKIINGLAGDVPDGTLSAKEEVILCNLYDDGRMSRVGFLSDKEKLWLNTLWERRQSIIADSALRLKKSTAKI